MSKLTDLTNVYEADKIFYNGTIYTMEEEGDTAEALATYKGKILFIGSYYQASLLRTEKT